MPESNYLQMSLLVSIIMPAYNAAKYVSESIESVIAQTYVNWELIFIDDGSTDDTANFVRQYEQVDQRIKYHYQQNGKQGKARNLGISKSSGSLLAFLDTDDYWLPQKLEKSLELFEVNNFDLFFCEAFIFSDNHNLENIKLLPTLGIVSGLYEGANGLSILLFKNQIPLLSVLVKREAVLSVRGFRDRGLAEDYELWLNLLVAGYRLKGFDIPLTAYRVHKHSSTFQDGMAVNGVTQMLTDFFQEHGEIKSHYTKQLKIWLKRYFELSTTSDKQSFDIPVVFNLFQCSITNYKILLRLKPLLPHKIFNYLLHKL